jgi:hypothetical protein
VTLRQRRIAYSSTAVAAGAQAGYVSSEETGMTPLRATRLRRTDRQTALSFVDAELGPPEDWQSPILRYALSAPFQEDWKEEVGHWLMTAQRFGFLAQLKQRVLPAKRGTHVATININDERRSHLLQELAPAMMTHYFSGTGWSFVAWEPIKGGAEDVDVALRAPSGKDVLFQVKAPDQPGHLVPAEGEAPAGFRVVRTPAEGNERDESGKLRPEVKTGGEADWKLTKVAAKAADVLPRLGSQAQFVCICPNRSPLSMAHVVLISYLAGRTEGEHGRRGRTRVTLPKDKRGQFWSAEWAHVSGLIVLELLRPENGDISYGCVVLLNPNAAALASADWFEHAHVLVLEGNTFRWKGGEPAGPRYVPDGTVVANE